MTMKMYVFTTYYTLNVNGKHAFKNWTLLLVLHFPYLFYVKHPKPHVPLSSLKDMNCFFPPSLLLSPFLLLVSFKSIPLINWLYKQSFKFSPCILISFFQSSAYWSNHLINWIKEQCHVTYSTLGHFYLKEKNADVCFYFLNDYNLKCHIGYAHR